MSGEGGRGRGVGGGARGDKRGRRECDGEPEREVGKAGETDVVTRHNKQRLM